MQPTILNVFNYILVGDDTENNLNLRTISMLNGCSI